MYNEQLEQLIDAALIDGELTEKEKQILLKKAQATGVDLDEFEMVLEARIFQSQSNKKNTIHAPNYDEPSTKTPTTSTPQNTGKMSSQKLSERLDNPLSEYSDVWINLDFDIDEPGEVLTAIEMSENKIKNIILNFPTPTDKEDMLDFLFYLKTQIQQSEHGFVFFAKFNECIDKIKMMYPGDVAFEHFIQITEGNNRIKVGAKGMSSYKFNKMFSNILSNYEQSKDYMSIGGGEDALGDFIESKSNAKSLIIAFPIPSDRDDLIDFMLYLKRQAFESEISNLLQKKFYECVNKARSLYPNDKEIIRIIDSGIKVSTAVSIKNGFRSIKHGSLTVFYVAKKIIKTIFILAIIGLIIWLVVWIVDFF